MNKFRRLIAAGAAVLTIASVSAAALAETAGTPAAPSDSTATCPYNPDGCGNGYGFVDENGDGICDHITDGTRGSGAGNAYGNRGNAGTGVGRGQGAGRMNGGRGANCNGSCVNQ